MARMPGAVWKPLPRGFGTRMARFDLVLIHTQVGSLAGTDGYFRSGKTASNSHFGTGGFGEIWQWGDTAFRSAANADGNHRSITIENADMGPGFGPWNTNDGGAVPAFTPQQIEANARICAWAHITHGVPLVAADTSRPNARGIGYHRLGCNPWRVPDGELWSSANGKGCPGPRRIAQIPQIITRAQQIVTGDDDMPLTDTDIQRIKHALMEAPVGGIAAETGLPRIEGTQDVLFWNALARVVNEVAAPLASRVPGSTYRDTTLGYAANADAYGHAVMTELTGLRAAVDFLAQQRAEDGQLDLEAFRAVLREELPKLDVVVSVGRGDEAAAEPTS